MELKGVSSRLAAQIFSRAGENTSIDVRSGPTLTVSAKVTVGARITNRLAMKWRICIHFWDRFWSLGAQSTLVDVVGQVAIFSQAIFIPGDCGEMILSEFADELGANKHDGNCVAMLRYTKLGWHRARREPLVRFD